MRVFKYLVPNVYFLFFNGIHPFFENLEPFLPFKIEKNKNYNWYVAFLFGSKARFDEGLTQSLRRPAQDLHNEERSAEFETLHNIRKIRFHIALPQRNVLPYSTTKHQQFSTTKFDGNWVKRAEWLKTFDGSNKKKFCRVSKNTE